MVKERLVIRRRKRITAMMMTSKGYRFRGGCCESVWLAHSSWPPYT